MSHREGAGIYLLAHIFLLWREQELCQNTCETASIFPQAKVSWDAFSSIFFVLHFRLIATISDFCLGFWFFVCSGVFCCLGCLSLPRSTQCASGKRHHHQAMDGWELQLDKNYNLRKEGTEILFFCLIFSTIHKYNDWRSRSKITLIQTAITEILAVLEFH